MIAEYLASSIEHLISITLNPKHHYQSLFTFAFLLLIPTQ